MRHMEMFIGSNGPNKWKETLARECTEKHDDQIVRMRAKFLYNIVMFGENKLLDKVKKDCLAYANLSLEEKDMFPTQELEAHRQRCEEIRRNREFKDDESLD